MQNVWRGRWYGMKCLHLTILQQAWIKEQDGGKTNRLEIPIFVLHRKWKLSLLWGGCGR